LLYLFIVPPWQHYDEPGHFEHAWLIANRPTLPQPGDFDPAMRRTVAASMIEHDFYRGGAPPDLSQPDPLPIGLSQIDDYVAYYWLAALPLRFLQDADITHQLYATRMVSLLLFLLSIAGCWGAIRELTQPNNSLRWLLPMCLALLPAFADIMTAANNDSAAIAFSTWLIWGIVRLIQRGFSWVWLMGCAIGSVACLWSKTTTFPVVAGLALALPLSLLRGRGRWLVWAVAAATTLFIGATIIQWDDARGWFRASNQEAGVRRAVSQTPVGQYAFALESSAGSGMQIQQVIAPELTEALRGQTVTLGMWGWTDSQEPQSGYLPVLLIATTQGVPDTSSPYQKILLTTQPTYYSITTTLPENTARLWLALTAPVKPAKATTTSTLFLDEISLTKRVANGIDLPGNFVINSSAEFGVVRFRSSWQTPFAQLLRADPNHFVGALLDPHTRSIYISKFMNLSLQTFWARFAWGHVALRNPGLNLLLNFILVSGFLSSSCAVSSQLVANRGNLSIHTVHTLIVLGLISFGVCIAAIARANYILFLGSWFPSARYIYPAVMPVLLAVVGGWVMLFRQITPHHSQPFGEWVILALFASLNIYSLISIVQFYA
jgi:hypothetical protein